MSGTTYLRKKLLFMCSLVGENPSCWSKIDSKRRRGNVSKVLEWERSMNEIPMTVLQIKKLRRRVEDALRKSDVETLLQIAKLLGLRVQKDLEKIKNDISRKG